MYYNKHAMLLCQLITFITYINIFFIDTIKKKNWYKKMLYFYKGIYPKSMH